MKIIVHSTYSAQTISTNMGRAEYSYYFVLAGYLPALRQLGEVVAVNDPLAEVDALFDACQAAGEACVFLCFTPPHLVPVTLRCPTIPVFAWEFSTIPCEMWGDDPRCDWRVVFAHCKRAITLSTHTAALVRAAMGEDFPVFAIPTASFEAFADISAPLPVSAERRLRLHGYLFDSAAESRFRGNPPWPLQAAPHFGPLPVEPPAPPPPPPPVAEPAPPPEPARAGLRKRLSITVYYLRGWYRDVLRDILPRPLSRLVSFTGRSGYRAYRLVVPLPAIAVAPPPPPPPPAEVLPPAPLPLPECDVTLRGVVYASVFSPVDGRKNWQDMLMGFVWAFRDNPDATLILKVPVRGGLEAYPSLYALLTQFSPFRCRIILFAGYLDDAEYRTLVDAATYYLNASHAEGLCLPLMEFLSAGRPAVAPNHTAMADYIDERIAFVLKANLEHNVWPFDPRDLFTTMRYRLNWESLVTALHESFAAATTDTARYTAMGAAAREAMRGFCTLPLVQEKLAVAITFGETPAQIENGMVTA
jgi:glycosyltransferase involved in cell wall biosynthesis